MGMFTGSVLAAKQQQNQPSNSKISQATAKLAGWLRARSSAGSCIHDTCGLSMLCLQRVPLMQRDSKNSRLDLSRVLASLSVTASREHPSAVDAEIQQEQQAGASIICWQLCERQK